MCIRDSVGKVGMPAFHTTSNADSVASAAEPAPALGGALGGGDGDGGAGGGGEGRLTVQVDRTGEEPEPPEPRAEPMAVDDVDGATGPSG